MARLLEALEIDRLLQHGIGDRCGERLDDRAGAPLGMQNLLPERHRAEPRQGRFVELGPRQVGRHVILVGGVEMAAEQRLVRLRSDRDIRVHSASHRPDLGRLARGRRRRRAVALGNLAQQEVAEHGDAL